MAPDNLFGFQMKFGFNGPGESLKRLVLAREAYWLDGEQKVEIVDSAHDIARAVVTLRFVVQNRQKTVWGSCVDVILV